MDISLRKDILKMPTQNYRKYESQRKAQKGYEARVYRTIPFRLNANTEADILEKLDSVDNKRQYIISLIREDILKNG